MLVRPALPKDIPQIVAIEQIPEFRNYIGAWSADQHRIAMADPDSEYFVASGADDEVHGFAILQDLASPHRSIQLRRLAVRTPGLGLGRSMLAFVIERAFHHHRAHRLWLDVFDTNTRARRLYKAFGFHEEGMLREAILRDGAFHNQVLMSLLDREHAATCEPQQLPST